VARSDEGQGLLYERAQLAAQFLLASIVFLAIGSYLTPVADRDALQLAQGGHLVSQGLIYLGLRRPRPSREVIYLCLAMVLSTLAFICLGSLGLGDATAPLISIIGLTMGTATLLPWGVGPQLLTVIASLLGSVWMLDRLAVDTGYWLRSGGSVLPILVGTIYVAYVYARTSQTLSRGEDLSRTIIERAAMGIAHVSARGRVLTANPALGRMLGIEPEHLRGRLLEHLLHPADRGRDAVAAQELTRQERTGYQSDRRLLRSDGGVIWARLSVSALPGDRGKVERVVLVEDVTASKNAERALRAARLEAERASRAKGEFLATMSHEIRTPMNAILGSAELLTDTQMSEQQAQYLDAIRTGGEQLLSLIDDVLDFSKIEAGRVELEDTVLDLRALIGKVQGLFTSQARRKRIELKCTVDPELPVQVRGDATRLQQVLSNLVGNAIKFTEGGIVYIRVNKVEELESERVVVLIEVSDTGVGMGEDTLQRLFRPFTQADGSTTRRYGGTGLGLSIVKQLVELMGGEIGAESMPAVGSTFWARIPFDVQVGASEIPVNLVRRRETAARLRGLRVLVAEDHPMNQLVIARILETLGCDTDLVSDGIQAVKAVQKHDYAAVLMDIHMPGMDGIEATRMICENAGTLAPYVIGVSASALEEDRRRCLDAGMQAFLTKPVRREELQQALLESISNLAETGRFRTVMVGTPARESGEFRAAELGASSQKGSP
jgi:PAS domain S-box-containing protein